MESFQSLLDELHLHRNANKSRQMKAYMKDNFTFIGIPSPLRKNIQKTYINEWTKEDISVVVNVIDLCWKDEHRELQYIGMDLANATKKKFQQEHIENIESWIVKKSWWDTVDGFASNSVGYLLLAFPHIRDKKIEKWMQSGNMWLERTAILHQLKYKERTDINLLRHLINQKKEDHQFFIQKAIGWALRQYSKHNKEEVIKTLDMFPELSTLAKREASKYL